jgi:hypothetical protein
LELHGQADHSTGGAGPDLDEVTKLVHQPYSLAPALVGGRDTTPGQRVADVAAVLDLADQLIAGGPDGHSAAAAGVAVGVGGKLADREDQVTDPARGGSGAAGVLGDERPDPGVRIPGRAA